MQNLKDVIKGFAKKKGLTQKQLALNIGMTEAGYIRQFNSATLKVETLRKIAHELDISVLAILTEWDSDLKLEMVAAEPNETYQSLGARVKRVEDDLELLKKIVLK